MSKSSRRIRGGRRGHQTYQLQDFWPQKASEPEEDTTNPFTESQNSVVNMDSKAAKMANKAASREAPAILDYRSAVIRRNSTTSSSRPSTPLTPSPVLEVSPSEVAGHPNQQQVQQAMAANTFSYNMESLAMDENENQHLKLRNVTQDPLYKEMSMEVLEHYTATLKQQLSYKDRKLHFLQNPKPRLAEINYNETLQSAWAASEKLHQSYLQFESVVKQRQQLNEVVLAREMQEKETLRKEIERLKVEVETVKSERDRIAIEGKKKQEALTVEIIQLRNQLTHAQSSKTFCDPVRTYYESDVLPKIANNLGQCIEFNHQMNMVLSRMKFSLDPVGNSVLPPYSSHSMSPVEGMYSTDSPKSNDFSYDPSVPRGC